MFQPSHSRFATACKALHVKLRWLPFTESVTRPRDVPEGT